jgi:DNA mismatch endonuclease, patch repair protein
MTDVHKKKQRSFNMSRIRGRNTGPEMKLRSLLHTAGYRYGLHRNDLPGKPDVVLTKYKAVIFVHGCFWHRHAGCRFATTPQNNAEFWREKLDRNVARDKRDVAALESSGWKVIRVWECELRKSPDKILRWLKRLLPRKETRFVSRI